MKDQMLGIDNQIKQDDRDGNGYAVREMELIEQAKAVTLCPHCRADCTGWKQKTDDKSINHDDTEVGWPALIGKAQLAAREYRLCQRHAGKDRNKCSEPEV